MSTIPELEIVDNQGVVEDGFGGSVATLPSVIAWNGVTGTGALAPVGTYTAVLTIDYYGLYKSENIQSASFTVEAGMTPVGVVN